MKITLDGFENWLMNKGLKKRTVSEYAYYFGMFWPLGSLTQETVMKFLEKPTNRNVVARSFIMHYRKFLLINQKELGLTAEQSLEIASIELPRLTGRTSLRLVKPLSEGQVLEIEKHLPREKEKLQLLLSYYCGLRAGELLKIQMHSFNWEDWKKDMTQYGECRVYGKGDKEGIALVPPEIMKRVARYCREGGFVSLSSYIFLRKVESIENVKMEGRLVDWERKLKKAAITAGVIQFDSAGKIIPDTDVYPHKLRHSWGYYLKNIKKMDIRDIQEILRHSSIESTQRYTYTDKSDLKKLLRGATEPRETQGTPV